MAKAFGCLTQTLARIPVWEKDVVSGVVVYVSQAGRVPIVQFQPAPDPSATIANTRSRRLVMLVLETVNVGRMVSAVAMPVGPVWIVEQLSV